MKRRTNWRLWTGFGVTLSAALSYLPIFVLFPLTRDIPWVNILLFLVGGYLLGAGLFRTFTNPAQYRGKVAGPILGLLTLALVGMFCYGVFFAVRDLPSAASALRVGQQAPDFSLTTAEGQTKSLAQLLAGKRAVLLIFYRGYW